MELWILNENFNTVSVISRFESLLWDKKWDTIGNFQLVASSEYSELAASVRDPTKIRYVFRADSNYTGRIDNIVYEDGKIIATGSFLEELPSFRVETSHKAYIGNVETVMHDVVNSNCIINKPIPYLTLGENHNNGTVIDTVIFGKHISDFLYETSKVHGCSYSIRYDIEMHKLVFNVLWGKDRTQEQTVNDWCLFGRQWNNVYTEQYETNTNYANYATVYGEGEDESRIFEIVDIRAPGEEMRETTIDARDLKSEGLAVADYKKLLYGRGKEKLAEQGKFENIVANVRIHPSMPYDLGDIVSVKHDETGAIFYLRITEEKETFEGGSYEKYISFGERQGGVMSAIKTYSVGGGNSASSLLLSTGDMLKLVYDKDNNGTVDDSQKLGGKLPAYYAAQSDLESKVDKVQGKQLSTEDYTTDEKNKLADIAEKAQVNIIEVIMKNGEVLQITGNKEVNIPVPTKVSELANDSKYLTTVPDATTSVKGIATLGASGGAARFGQKGDVGLGNADNTSDINKPISTSAQTALNAKEDKSNKGQANGYASLDANQKVPLYQINDAILGNVNYQGLWNANSNVPMLPTVPTQKGHYWVTTEPGTQFGITFDKGDWIIADNGEWGKVDNTDAVTSVFGRTGNVTGTKNDVGLGNVDNTSDVNKPVSTAVQAALNNKVDKVSGKQLSTEDYTTPEKNKLAGITAGADMLKSTYDTNSNGIVDNAEKLGGQAPSYYLPTTGNSSNTVNTFTQATVRANLSSGEKTSVSLGKLMKWFADLGTLAFKGAVSKIDLDTSLQTEISNKEPAFSKNSAFNKNFGTAADTVCQGNDSRLSNARTPTAHNHDASNINSGTMSPARIAQDSNNRFMTDSEKTKLTGIAAGAQVNVIESLKRNGAALTITSKGVDISVPTKLSELTNDMGALTSVPDANATTKGITTLGASGGAARYGQKGDVGLGNVGNTADSVKIVKGLLQTDSRSTNPAPFDAAYPSAGLYADFKYNTADGLKDGGTYHRVLTYRPWSDSSGGIAMQMAFTDNGNVWIRASSGSTWGEWVMLTKSTDNIATATKLQTGRKINNVVFDGSADITIADNTKEPAFTKNSAFNKNFGTAADTVCQGNDSRLSNARTPTAHNHDASNINSGTMSPARIAQDASNRLVTDTQITSWSAKPTIEAVNTLIQTIIGAAPASLDTLKEIGDALNNDPNFANTILNHITSLQAAVNGKEAAITTLPVSKGGTGAKTLTGLVKGNGAGAMTAAVAGTDYVAPNGSISGNAATATKLQTARTISLTGDVTGSGSFDGSANLSISAAVANDSHSHTELSVKSDNYKDALALPSTYPRGVTVFFSNNPSNKFNDIAYGTVQTIKGYSNMACIQYIYPYNVDAPIYYRYGLYNSDTWKSWRTIATDAVATTAASGLMSIADKLKIDGISANTAFGGNQNTITTEQFLTLLTSLGAFKTFFWVARGTWSYAANQIISDTGCGNIHLVGSVVEVYGTSSEGCTIRITCPTTTSGGTAKSEFIYINNGPTYSPGWRKCYNTANLVNATTGVSGLMSSSDKSKLDGIAAGAEANQNAFSNILVGSTTIAADSKTDTLTIAAGTNVTITPDATNDKITINATNTTYGVATQSANGLLSAADKAKLDKIAAEATKVTVENSVSSTSTTNAASAKAVKDTYDLAASKAGIELLFPSIRAIALNTIYNTDGSKKETFSGGSLLTVYNTDGSKTETLTVGTVTTKLKTIYNTDGSISRTVI